jgi:hypothetical protein
MKHFLISLGLFAGMLALGASIAPVASAPMAPWRSIAALLGAGAGYTGRRSECMGAEPEVSRSVAAGSEVAFAVDRRFCPAVVVKASTAALE